MKNPFFERCCRYSIRKLSVGACSLMIGAVLFAGPALAKETAVPENNGCLLYTSPSPRDRQKSRMPSSA